MVISVVRRELIGRESAVVLAVWGTYLLPGISWGLEGVPGGEREEEGGYPRAGGRFEHARPTWP